MTSHSLVFKYPNSVKYKKLGFVRSLLIQHNEGDFSSSSDTQAHPQYRFLPILVKEMHPPLKCVSRFVLLCTDKAVHTEAAIHTGHSSTVTTHPPHRHLSPGAHTITSYSPHLLYCSFYSSLSAGRENLSEERARERWQTTTPTVPFTGEEEAEDDQANTALLEESNKTFYVFFFYLSIPR